MSPDDFDLQQAERKVYQLMYYRDGLWDISLGLTLMVMSLAPLFEQWVQQLGFNRLTYLLPLAVLLVLVILITTLLRIYLILPRRGLARMAQERKGKMRKARLMMLGLVLLTFALVILTAARLFPSPSQSGNIFLVPLFISGGAVVVLSLVAYLQDISRLYFYAWLIGFSILMNEVLLFYTSLHNTLSFGLVGGIILIVGLVLLKRFLNQYPLPQNGTAHDE